jgi:hypothetical protein
MSLKGSWRYGEGGSAHIRVVRAPKPVAFTVSLFLCCCDLACHVPLIDPYSGAPHCQR